MYGYSYSQIIDWFEANIRLQNPANYGIAQVAKKMVQSLSVPTSGLNVRACGFSVTAPGSRNRSQCNN